MKKPTFSYGVTNDTVTVVIDGKTNTVRKGAPNYVEIRKAILEERFDDVRSHLTPALSVEAWAKGKFKLVGNSLSYDGEKIPAEFNERIFKMAAGGESPEPLFKFYERLQKNPSNRAVVSLWNFMQHNGIPITEDGHLLAYKGITTSYKDCHTKTFDNRPGVVNEMPRNKISDDPNNACDPGFHVGSEVYAKGFGQVVVICKVDPADVVSVPYDENGQKMRVCKYVVVGHYNGQMPSTTIATDDVPNVEADEADELDEAEDESEIGSEVYEGSTKPSKTKPTPIKPPGKTIKVHKRRKHAFDKLALDELLEKSIAELRDYAGNFLRIVGASKIPGGKVNLVDEILKVREV